MTDWLKLAIANIGPMTTVAEGVAHLVSAAVTEAKSTDSTETKAETIIADVAAELPAIVTALTSNTPVAVAS